LKLATGKPNSFVIIVIIFLSRHCNLLQWSRTDSERWRMQRTWLPTGNIFRSRYKYFGQRR